MGKLDTSGECFFGRLLAVGLETAVPGATWDADRRRGGVTIFVPHASASASKARSSSAASMAGRSPRFVCDNNLAGKIGCFHATNLPGVIDQ